MKNKKFIGRYCDIVNPNEIFSYWTAFFDDNNLPKDKRWKVGYEPKDLKNWKIIKVGENKYYQNGVFLLEKDNHIVIYDAESVRIRNNGILKYHIRSDNYILQKYFQGKNHRIIINGNYIDTYYFDFGNINNIWEASLWNSI